MNSASLLLRYFVMSRYIFVILRFITSRENGFVSLFRYFRYIFVIFRYSTLIGLNTVHGILGTPVTTKIPAQQFSCAATTTIPVQTTTT